MPWTTCPGRMPTRGPEKKRDDIIAGNRHNIIDRRSQKARRVRRVDDYNRTFEDHVDRLEQPFEALR
eukprot:5584310-Pyramimonas_sp.AAC.1